MIPRLIPGLMVAPDRSAQFDMDGWRRATNSARVQIANRFIQEEFRRLTTGSECRPLTPSLREELKTAAVRAIMTFCRLTGTQGAPQVTMDVHEPSPAEALRREALGEHPGVDVSLNWGINPKPWWMELG